MKELGQKLAELKNNVLSVPLELTFEKLKKLYKTYPDLPHEADLLKNIETFGFMIDYYAKKTEDPQREKIYDQTILNTIFIIDALNEYYKATQAGLNNIYEHYFSHDSIISLLQDPEGNKAKILRSLWLTDRYDALTVKSLTEFLKNKTYVKEYGALIVTGISLSLWRIFDTNKFNLLTEIYKNSEDVIAVRSLTGIIFAIYIHSDIFETFESLSKKFLDLLEDADTYSLAEFIILQHIKSLETEDIIEEFQNEILPGMQEIQKNMNDIEILNIEEAMDDENPDWLGGKNSKLEFLEKMEEFTMRQFEGADIYSPTLGKMKDFPFFNNISHWLIPFSADNEDAKQALSGLKDIIRDKFLNFLEKSSFFCDSDKYSFCFHFSALPRMLQNTVAKMMIEQMGAMEEMNQDDENPEETTVIVHYLQDLYRFFNFSQFKGFENIFNPSLGLINIRNILPADKHSGLYLEAAELYMKQGLFSVAADLFYILSVFTPKSEFFEKAGFCFQKIKDYEAALEMYKKAELQGSENQWLLKKLGFVNLKLNNYDEALKYYLNAENNDPNDVSIIFQIGTCYVYKEEYEKALKYFFKADYLKPNRIKTWRSIAYSSLKLKKIDQAEKYANKCAVNPKVEKIDYLILGTIARIKGDLNESVDYFMTALYDYKGNYEKFLKDFSNYQDILAENGIPWIENDLLAELIFKKFFDND